MVTVVVVVVVQYSYLTTKCMFCSIVVDVGLQLETPTTPATVGSPHQ